MTWHLLNVGPSLSEKSFNGLDKILLLSWLKKQLSASDECPFVLHYWDLRPPNIIIDEGNTSLVFFRDLANSSMVSELPLGGAVRSAIPQRGVPNRS